MDLTGILMKTQAPGHIAAISKNEEVYPPPPPPLPHTEACAADEDFLRRRRGDLSSSRLQEERPPPLLARRVTFGGGSRDAEVQCTLGGEIPKKVYFTPRGTCVHSSKGCSTLNSSTKFQERDMCQKCVNGQREEVDARGF